MAAGLFALHLAALRRAIELNGVKVTENLQAFDLGRLAVQDPSALESLLPGQKTSNRAESVDEQIKRYQQELARYQNKALADHFTAKVQPLRPMFEAQGHLHQWARLCSTYYKLLAFKDEYEVARLHSDPQWRQETLGQFEPGANLYFHFAPAWLAGHTARPRKIKLGAWLQPLLKALSAIRGIRGTWFDPFKGTLDRKNQTLLMNWFESWIELMHNNPSMVQHSKSVDHTLDLFNQVKGFGQVRIESFDKVRFDIQKSVESKTNLDQHDQDRQQT